MLYRRIRDLREDKDLTQKQMGEILSCSQRVYSNYERGDLDIPTEILIKLADFHNVSVDYILNRTDKKDFLKARKDEAFLVLFMLVKFALRASIFYLSCG